MSVFKQTNDKMLAATKYIKDASAFRRMLFAATFLPEDLPNYWQVLVEFGTKGKTTETGNIENTKLLFQNMKDLDCTAFATDQELFSELISFKIGTKPLGVILISCNDTCLTCKSNLLLRKDRPAQVIVYDDIMGSVSGSHYHKYCRNRSCGFTQYYGYYTTGGSSNVYYNSDWKCLSYFVSSRETAFSMKLMEQFDAQIFIGQLSFKQCADLYNYVHTCGRRDQMSQ